MYRTSTDYSIADWLRFIADKKTSTLTTYSRIIKLYKKFLSDKGIVSPNRDTVMDYRNYLLQKVKPSTGRLYLTVIKLFVKWQSTVNPAMKDYAADVDNIKIDTSTHSKDALTADEGRKLLARLNCADESEKKLRDRAMIMLMAAIGLRTVEITRLDVGDIVKMRGKLFLQIFGKGRSGKNEFVMLPAKCYELIQAYLKVRAEIHGTPTADSPMFMSTARSNRGARLQTQSVSRIAKAALKDTGFDSPRLTAHSLRHTAATLMLSAGADIAAVQKVLRHKSINTTMIYRHDLDLYNNNAVNYSADALFGEEV